jgi:hypothetical protein
MGMFDHLYYEGREYQTKDTPNQALDNYKIEHDQCSGHIFLWREDYDAEWVDDEGFLGGSMKTSNHRWVHCWDFDGNIRFYRTENNGETWIEYSALFMDGRLLRIKRIEDNEGVPVLENEEMQSQRLIDEGKK